MISEIQLSQYIFGDLIKICGIVKTKNENQKSKTENFYEKMIEIMNFTVLNKEVYHCQSVIKINDYEITNSDISKFSKIANSKIASSLFCNHLFSGFSSSMDLLKYLLIFFLFGENEKLNLSIINFSNDESSSNMLRCIADFKKTLCLYTDFSQDVHSKEDLLNIKKQSHDKNSKLFKIGKILNSKESTIIFNNLNEKPHENLIKFMNSNLYSKLFDVQLVLNNTENYQFSQFSQAKQMLIKTNIVKTTTTLANKNNPYSINNLSRDFYSLNQNFDMIYLNYDKVDFQKDKKMTKSIIDNQFYFNKKRSSNDIKTQIENNKIPEFNQLFEITSFNDREIQFLENIDSLSFFKFYKINNLEKFEKSGTLKEMVYSEPNLLFKYCIFANNYIFPKLSDETYNKILILEQCIKTSYSVINTSDFDIISKIVKLLTIFAVISCKLDLRIEVIDKDIIISFLLLKEILNQILNFDVSHKKENVNKTKKNKYTFVIETIKKLCQENNKKEFTMNDLIQACSHIQMNGDLIGIIEQLNYNGTVIKIAIDEYKLCG